MDVCTYIYHAHNLGNVNICWKVQTREKDRNYLTPKGERFIKFEDQVVFFNLAALSLHS